MVRMAWRTLDVLALSTQLERGEVDLALACSGPCTGGYAPAPSSVTRRITQ